MQIARATPKKSGSSVYLHTCCLLDCIGDVHDVEMMIYHLLRDLARASRRLAWLVATWACGAGAQTAPDLPPLRLNGFGSLALTRTLSSGEQALRRDISQRSQAHTNSFATDSRLGLQLHYDARLDLELVSQVVVKKRLVDSPWDAAVEWLFAAYRPTSDLIVRIGRTNPDVFLLSDATSVGFAYPWIRPNSDFYVALPVNTMDGFDLSWSVQDGDSNWRFKGFAGTAQPIAVLSTKPGEAFHYKIRPAFGVTVSRENEGLLLRSTVARGRVGAQMPPVANQGLQSLRLLEATAPLPEVAKQAAAFAKRADMSPSMATFYELGLSYERDNWLISAEFSQLDMQTGSQAAKSAYASVGRRLGDVTLYGMVGKSVSSFDALPAPNWDALGPEVKSLGVMAARWANGARVDQHSLSIGARWDFHPQVALKLQVDQFWIAPNGGALWIGDEQQASKPRVWSGSLDFVF
jgi:hypothetical protein